MELSAEGVWSGQKVQLRRLRSADARLVFQALNIEGMTDGLLDDAPSTLEEVVERLAEDERRWSKGTAFAFAVLERRVLVGRADLRPDPHVPTALNLGFWIAKPRWGHGLATDTARVALRVAFEDLAVDEVWAGAASWNGASQAILEKLMVHREHRDRGFRKDGCWVANERFSLSAATWRERSAAEDVRSTGIRPPEGSVSQYHLPAPWEEIVTAVKEASQRLEASVAQLDDRSLEEPTALPGWTRGHVIAHLTHSADAFFEVTAAALEGELRETYPGGDEARNSAIERDARRSAAEATEGLRAANERLARLWDSRSDDDWQLPVLFRNGVLGHLLAARWREVEIHHTDLDVGYPPSRWTSAFSHHAIDFLLPRLEQAEAVELIATDTGGSWQSAPQSTVKISGKAHQLAAWLAGRASPTALEVSPADAPALGPWP